MNIQLLIGWQIQIGKETHSVEPVLFQLLSLIKQHGSLQTATNLVGVSYRYAWGLLNKWQHRFGGRTLVVMEQGRGAYLSTLGEKLLNADLQINARLSPELDNFSTAFKRDLSSLLSESERSALKIFASHGLAVSALRDLISQQSDFTLDLHFHGSVECLQALETGQCDIAGFHIPIGPIARDIQPQYTDIIKPDSHQLIYIVRRNQGLMFAKDNPKQITSIQSLADSDIRFVNRQSGSGTRLLFDQLLTQAKLNPRQITGYQHEEFTHLAVAALVASDMADVGFGIAPMAEKFKLGFLPLIWEHYCLAVPKLLANDSRVKQIKNLLQSDDYRQLLSNSTGYESDRSGETVSFTEIFSS